MKKIVLVSVILMTSALSTFSEELSDKLLPDKPLPEKPPIENPLFDKSLPTKTLPPKPKKTSLTDKVAQINALDSDKEKIMEWVRFSSKENYLILDKKNCCATVYDSYGYKIKEFEVGIGREIGDDYNDTSGIMGKAKNTTPAGEYTLNPNIYNTAAYGDLTLSLGTKACKSKHPKQEVALHKIPKFRLKERAAKFYDGNLANNRMSHGCINFTEKDFKDLTKYIHGGLKVYILPEEKGNKLVLEKNTDGKFEFEQTKY